MADNNRYHITTNSNRRRILVIDQAVNIDDEDALAFEDFDAMFINVVDSIMYQSKLAVSLASPIISEKCRFKPCFVTRRMQGWLGEWSIVVDGYALSPEDTIVAQTIEEVYANMRRINFLLGTDPVITHAQEIIRLCRYAISRGWYTFSNLPTPGVHSGYMALYYYTIWNEEHEIVLNKERNFFHKQLLDLGYITEKRFIDKLHFCPKCNRSHLLFFETCPKCGSSDIFQEDVIHHFRCANIAPASAYEWDGELRCPKCKQFLRHIGVDYDKPSSIFTCKQCGESFMYPSMRVLCASCRSTLTTDELIPTDAREYEFTPDGIRAFANYDISYTLNLTGFTGHGTMREMEEQIRNLAKASDNKTTFIVGRFHIYNPEDLLPGTLSGNTQLIMKLSRLFNYKSALSGNEFYFLREVNIGEVADSINHMEFEIGSEFADYAKHHPGFQFQFVESFTYHHTEDIDQFITRIKDDTIFHRM